jgi:hypothetical protein
MLAMVIAADIRKYKIESRKIESELHLEHATM